MSHRPSTRCTALEQAGLTDYVGTGAHEFADRMDGATRFCNRAMSEDLDNSRAHLVKRTETVVGHFAAGIRERLAGAAEPGDVYSDASV